MVFNMPLAASYELDDFHSIPVANRSAIPFSTANYSVVYLHRDSALFDSQVLEEFAQVGDRRHRPRIAVDFQY